MDGPPSPSASRAAAATAPSPQPTTATPSCTPASRSASAGGVLDRGRHRRRCSALWSAATATYFAFRDDVLTRLIARQAEMQFAYEDRIAELRAQVDRTTSRQLLDQEQFDQKLEQIMRRQTTLESRATALGGMPDRGHRLDQPPAPRRGDASGARRARRSPRRSATP